MFHHWAIITKIFWNLPVPDVKLAVNGLIKPCRKHRSSFYVFVVLVSRIRRESWREYESRGEHESREESTRARESWRARSYRKRINRLIDDIAFSFSSKTLWYLCTWSSGCPLVAVEDVRQFLFNVPCRFFLRTRRRDIFASFLHAEVTWRWNRASLICLACFVRHVALYQHRHNGAVWYIGLCPSRVVSFCLVSTRNRFLINGRLVVVILLNVVSE